MGYDQLLHPGIPGQAGGQSRGEMWPGFSPGLIRKQAVRQKQIHILIKIRQGRERICIPRITEGLTFRFDPETYGRHRMAGFADPEPDSAYGQQIPGTDILKPDTVRLLHNPA